MSAPSRVPSTSPALATWEWISLALLAGAIVAATLQLLPQWRHNPDLSHGWFTPLIFLLLVHEARSRGTQRFLPPNPLTGAAIVGCLLAGFSLVVIGGLYMAAVEWTHALVAIALTGALCAFLTAGWIVFSLKPFPRVPFNWCVAVAIGLWMLSVPLPPGTYATLTRELQSWVTDVVLGLLHLFGIVAVKNGNIIQLANVSVGVEEACSGVRSLLSCVYAGVFFSAALVRGPWARVVVIGIAAPLAIVMNVVRSLTLTLLAHAGVEIRGAWHDVTGFAVLGVTAALLAGISLGLDRRRASNRTSDTGDQPATPPAAPSTRPRHWPGRFLIAGLTIGSLLAILLVLNTRPATRQQQAAPNLAGILPEAFEGWDVVTDTDLYRFAPQLHTDHLIQRTYGRTTSDGDLQLTVYLAYWPIGQAPVSLVASHTPDACWPGSGWNAVPTESPRLRLPVAQRELDAAEYRLFSQDGYPQHVWYWHLFDGRTIYAQGVRSPRQLLVLALKYGFRRDGEQLFVRISSNQPWSVLASEPLVQEIVARLTPYGL